MYTAILLSSLFLDLLFFNNDHIIYGIFFLFLFDFFIALTGTSSRILNINGENEHCHLFPDLRGKACAVSPLSLMFAVVFS